jgi:hypothetical protein
VKPFDPQRVLPPTVLGALLDARATDPERAVRAARRRRRRPQLAPRGRLCLVALDHPARGSLGAGGDPTAMADRWELLARTLRALEAPGVDGVLATIDVIEELLLIDDIEREQGMAALLDDKVIMASLNRGGLAGAAWELDDPMTTASAALVEDWGLDGAKVLLRLNLDEPATRDTLVACADAVTAMARAHRPIVVEPLPVVRDGDAWALERDPARLAWAVSVAQSLGESSRYTWLKLPPCERFEEVARATTLPIALLGGGGELDVILDELEAALGSGPNVASAIVGRAGLFPPSGGDPKEAFTAIAKLVHGREGT